mgnify:CR=1 FL=1|jgi:hypothetical protein
MLKLLAALLFSTALSGQECSPYHNVTNWEYNNDVKYNIAWASCFHAAAIAASMEYKSFEAGTHIMGEGHYNTAYIFTSYNFKLNKSLNLSLGSLHRINNNPSLLLGQWGGCVKIYKPVWFIVRVLQINKDLSYLNVGIKLTI